MRARILLSKAPSKIALILYAGERKRAHFPLAGHRTLLGVHGVCVRSLSQKTPNNACIFVVLLTGLTFHLGLVALHDGFAPIPATAFWLSIAAGFFFMIATPGFYYAFQRGPVRLVAPLIAGYPVLSVGLAAAQGTPISALQWLAVVATISGVAIVAALSDRIVDAAPPKGPTIIFAVIAAVGFAGSFARDSTPQT